jgi:hypothetical protein
VTEQVQSEARVAEERQVGPGVRQRDGRMGVTQQLAHLVLVGVEQLAVEHRVELAVEAEVEEDVERVAARRLGERPDGLALQVPMLGPRDLGDGQVREGLVAEPVGDRVLADP